MSMIALHWNRSRLQCNKLAVKDVLWGILIVSYIHHGELNTNADYCNITSQVQKLHTLKNGFKASEDRQQRHFPKLKLTKGKAALFAKQHLIPSTGRCDTQGMGIVECDESIVERKVSHWNKVCCGCKTNYSPFCINPVSSLFQRQSYNFSAVRSKNVTLVSTYYCRSYMSAKMKMALKPLNYP